MQRKTNCLVWTISASFVLGSLAAAPVGAFWGTSPSNSCCAESCGTDSCGTTGSCGTGGQARSASGEIYDYLETGRQANAMWPYPYICPDRVWAHAPFDAMVNNGWRRQNLLGAHHFNQQTGKLTRAGELKVQWILTQTPTNRRQIFVERSMDTSETDARIATAQEFASGVKTDSGVALVQDTHIRSPRRPASMVDSERTSFIESRLPAVLPAGSTSTAASSN